MSLLVVLKCFQFIGGTYPTSKLGCEQNESSGMTLENSLTDSTEWVLMVRSFGLGIPGTRNVYIGMSVLLVVTSGNKS